MFSVLRDDPRFMLLAIRKDKVPDGFSIDEVVDMTMSQPQIYNQDEYIIISPGKDIYREASELAQTYFRQNGCGCEIIDPDNGVIIVEMNKICCEHYLRIVFIKDEDVPRTIN